MKHAWLSIVVALAFAPGVAVAQQQPEPKPAPSAPVPAPAPATPQPAALPGQLVNIRIDVTVSEEGGGTAASRKTVTLMLADRQPGSVRAFGTQTTQAGRATARLNVDAFPMVLTDGRVQTQVTLEYGPTGGGTSIRVEPLLASGKPLVVSQAADPLTDRRLLVELTATVIK